MCTCGIQIYRDFFFIQFRDAWLPGTFSVKRTRSRSKLGTTNKISRYSLWWKKLGTLTAVCLWSLCCGRRNGLWNYTNPDVFRLSWCAEFQYWLVCKVLILNVRLLCQKPDNCRHTFDFTWLALFGREEPGTSICLTVVLFLRAWTSQC